LSRIGDSRLYSSQSYRTFEILGCSINGSYDEMTTSIFHPTTDEDVFIILDPCHMLKLARNALAHLGTIVDGEENVIRLGGITLRNFKSYKKWKD
jgi:hypothetical protein